MVKLYFEIPQSKDKFKHQTKQYQASKEEFESVVESPKYSTFQKITQFLLFILFLGPIKLIVLCGSFIAFFMLVYLLPTFKFLFPNDKTFRVFCSYTLRPVVRLILFGGGIMKISISSLFDEDARFIVANNLSFIESVILFIISPVSMIVSTEYSQSRFLRSVGKVMNLIFVNPEEKSIMAQKLLECASDPLWLPIVAFPEFRATNGKAILGFRKSPFITEYTIQPVTFQYKLWLIPEGTSTVCHLEKDLKQYIWNLLAIPFITVKISTLEPLQFKETKMKPKERAIEAQLKMANTLGVPAFDVSGPIIDPRKKIE